MRNQIFVALFALALVAVATPNAEAVGIAKRIRLTQNLNETFQIAEIRAFESNTGINVAAQSNGGIASASSSGFGTNPGRANDNGQMGAVNQSFGGASVWHSAGGDQAGAFIEIDLADPSSLDTMTIFGRFPCCPNRQDNFLLEIFDVNDKVLVSQTVLGLGSSPGSQGTIEGLRQFTNIPEPATVTLGLLGVAGLMVRRRRTA